MIPAENLPRVEGDDRRDAEDSVNIDDVLEKFDPESRYLKGLRINNLNN